MRIDIFSIPSSDDQPKITKMEVGNRVICRDGISGEVIATTFKTAKVKRDDGRTTDFYHGELRRIVEG
jgi:preprotein translocase subunit YajC